MADDDMTCPHCGSTSTAAILYGLVRPDDGLQKSLAGGEVIRGEVILGGCCITDCDPIRHCNGCGRDFAYVTWLRPAPVDQSGP